MDYNVKIIYKEERAFSERLKELKDCPSKLYAIGNIDLLKSDSMAIVGSRKCSEYGLKMAEEFGSKLSMAGVTTVSGMAVRNRYSSAYEKYEYNWKYDSCFRRWI